MRYKVIISLVVFVLAAVPEVFAAVSYVDANASGANNGTSWTDAYTDLQAAISASASGTDLWIAQGTYYPGSARTDSFVMKSGVNLYGGFTNGMSSLAERDWRRFRSVLSGDVGVAGDDSDNSYHILTAVANGIADGLTLVDANANGPADADKQGAAILCTVNSFTARNCVILRNKFAGSRNRTGAVRTSGTGMVLENCLVAANAGDCVVDIQGNNTTVRNCVFINNSAGYVTVFAPSGNSGSQVLNCSFYGNAGTQVLKYYAGYIEVKNSVFWGNAGTVGTTSLSQLFLYYCNIEGCGGSGAGWTLPSSRVDMGGNIDADPLFVHGPTGIWGHAAVYAAGTDLTTLSDTNASFTPNALAGRILNPDSGGRYAFGIVSNTDTQIVVWGDASALGTAGKPYRIDDCHLQSTNGHWTLGGSFVADSQHSPCVDAGDPAGAYSTEPSPNGGRLNMGGYGNTEEASMSLDTQPPQDVGVLSAIPGNNQVVLDWKNPPNLDFAGVLVLRKTGSAPSGAPADGTAYSAGSTLGDADVVYAGTGDSATPGAASGWTDTAAVNGTHYYYKVFAYDAGPRYAPGAVGHTTPSASAGASPIYVDASAAGGNNGTSWADAFTDLQVALSLAVSGDQVWVAQGTYKPGTQRSDSFQPANGVTVMGGFTNGMGSVAERDWLMYPAVLSGDIDGNGALDAGNSLHVVKITATVTVDGLHITGGYPNGTGADNTGGGIYSTAAGMRLRNCVLTRNWVTAGADRGAALFNGANGPIVSNCVFAANSGGPAVYSSGSATLKNCLFLWNEGAYSAQIKGCNLVNCTFAENAGTQVYLRWGGDSIVKNSIVWGNSASLAKAGGAGRILVSYSDIQGSSAPGGWTMGTDVIDSGNNTDTNPLFVAAVTGSWTHAAVYSAGDGTTALTDESAFFVTDGLRGKYLNPDTSGKHWYYVAANSGTQLVVYGNASAVGTAGKSYSVFDAHLQSEAGHWTYGGVWSNDAQTSPCVDAGDPTDGLGEEPSPNGGRINMGAYGGTAQASKKLALPPDPVAQLRALPGDGEVELTWKNPFNAGFAGVLILRKTGSSPTGTPVGGVTYTEPGPLGDADIAYVGPGADATPGADSCWTNTALANGTHYYYMVFAYDGSKQYSSGEDADTTPDATAGASPIYVDDDATGGNNGTSWADAYTDLQTALAVAGNGDQVWIAEGAYRPGPERSDSFEPAAGVELYGGFTPAMTGLAERAWLDHPSVLSGDLDLDGQLTSADSRRVLVGRAGLVLDGLQIRGGYADGVGAESYGGGAYLDGNADDVRILNCVVARNYASAGGSGIYMLGEDCVVSNCVFTAHPAAGEVLYTASDSVSGNRIVNCLFLWNACGVSIQAKGYTAVVNCTFATNAGEQVRMYWGAATEVRNSIFWDNGDTIFQGGNAAQVVVSYSDVEGSGAPGAWSGFGGNVVDGGSNTDVNPLFVGGPAGSWTADAVYNAGADRTTLTDAGASFGANGMRGRFLNPNTAGNDVFYIMSNSANQLVVAGNASAIGTNGAPYKVEDCHLQSKQGSWSPQGWLYSPANSPCIDAGDPASAYAAEPEPNGMRINMGAYGNTPQASKTDVPEGSVIMVR